MSKQHINVIIPKTKEDLVALKKLDKEGKLITDANYPTKEQLDKMPGEEKNEFIQSP